MIRVQCYHTGSIHGCGPGRAKSRSPSPALGAGAREAYQEAALRALNVGTPWDEPQPQDSACVAAPLEQAGWRIERDSAGWRGVLFQQQGSELCILVVTPAGNRLYGLGGPQAGRRLLVLPAGQVAMVQWATGRSVARWTQMLSSLK